ncbi:M20 family metallopeptidase [Actinomadura sp. 9N407]|uniref:M20 family metallopeptidase n=1 Tax=Actinomadura sp. 9N407 TaxID=3375154 RepID=UPI00378AB0E4
MNAVELAQELVRLDTRAGNERQAADLVAAALAGSGFDVRIQEPIPGRANLIARRGAPSSTLPYGTRPSSPRPSSTPPSITFTGHLDTVPAREDEWSFSPTSGDIRDDRLLGRGSSDMKAGVAAQVAAAVRTSTPLQLIFTFGEETGCDGAALIDPSDLIPTDLLLVAEPTSNRVVLGHKGALWLRATARGVSAHGSRPELGRNAIAALAEAALRVHDHRPWPEGATVNVGTFHSGVQPNLVPDHAEMTLDIRTTPAYDSTQARAAITDLCGPEIELETLMDLPGIGTDPAGIKKALETLSPGTSPQPQATYFTDASVLKSKLGDPAVIIYGPGDPDQAHVTNETCSVPNIEACAENLQRLLLS